MSAERGWIGEPQPQTQWHDSHYSRQADKITAKSDPQPERTSIPGEERKWRIMMGNGQFLTDEDKDRLSALRETADPTNN
jgi:hypothetical protein